MWFLKKALCELLQNKLFGSGKSGAACNSWACESTQFDVHFIYTLEHFTINRIITWRNVRLVTKKRSSVDPQDWDRKFCAST